MKIPVRDLLVVVAALVVTIAPLHARKTQEQKEWLALQKAQPLTFTLPDAEAGAAWLRAKTWIATNARLPIQTADENVIQTQADTNNLDPYPLVTITRVQLASGDWAFAVSGKGSGETPSERKRSLRALAFHVASGVPYPGDPEEE